MKALRAFLFSRDRAGVCEVSVYRDLEPLVEAATKLVSEPQSSAAIHVGFWRPETASVATLLSSWPGAVLVSDSASGALPSPKSLSSESVGECDGAAFRLVLDGFGYAIVDPTIAGAFSDGSRSSQASASQVPLGWVAQMSSMDQRLAKQAANAAVWDEASYQAREADLPPRLRWDLGLARMAALSNGRPDPAGIIDALWACPPWFMDLPLSHLNLQVRQINVCRAHGYEKVASISSLGTGGLLKLPNMGQGSVTHLSKELHSALMSGAGLPRDELAMVGLGDAGDGDTVTAGEGLSTSFAPPSAGFRAELLALEEFLGERPFEVWTSRLGFLREPSTLQQIAERMGLTRERVRQIESKVHQKLQFHPLWLTLTRRLEEALHGRDSALLIDGLAAVDPWFEGAESFATAFVDVFEHLMSSRFGAFKVSGAWVVSHLARDDWNEVCRSARAMLESCAEDRIEEDYARSLCDGLLVGKGEELRDDLWGLATERAVWAEPPNGPRRLVSFGRGAEGVVKAVLEASDRPLHYSEIHRRASTMPSAPHDIRSIVNAANAVGLLYGRGTYGLLSHCPLDDAELASVRAELEDAMAGGDQRRQWHASELCDAMQELGLGFDGRLTKHVVSIALRQSRHAVDLGRMVWSLKGLDDEESTARLDVRQAVISLLEREGRPMSTAEIRAKLIAGRGVNESFQICPSESLVRIGPSLWGLAERDVDSEASRAFLASLRSKLEERQVGLHLGEMAEALGLALPPGAQVDRSLLAMADAHGMRIDRGQYAYLTEWGSSRRVAIPEAARMALAERSEEGASFDDICERVEIIARRRVPRNHVSQALRGIDAELDPATGIWMVAQAQLESADHPQEAEA